MEHERRDSHEVIDVKKKGITVAGNTDEYVGGVKTPSEFELYESSEIKATKKPKKLLKIQGLAISSSGRGHGGPDTPRQVSLNRDDKPIND